MKKVKKVILNLRKLKKYQKISKHFRKKNSLNLNKNLNNNCHNRKYHKIKQNQQIKINLNHNKILQLKKVYH